MIYIGYELPYFIWPVPVVVGGETKCYGDRAEKLIIFSQADLGHDVLVQYKPSPQESEVLGKCFEDAKWYYMNAPLAAGALVWSCK